MGGALSRNKVAEPAHYMLTLHAAEGLGSGHQEAGRREAGAPSYAQKLDW